MGEVVVKILSMFGGWGWITIGAIILVGATIMFAVYLREPCERQAFWYSLRNYLGAVCLGLLAIGLGAAQLWHERRPPHGMPTLNPAGVKAMKK